ncbi:Tripartite ATP-independent periplasmic transporter, DctQ component [Calidithermus terrae]|uniref:Tripartite ATP-independent periplasmic transporter, DctQ component n=1 Tax=Calidithermus terrae TaxID=1408545 RepID=A0A399EPD9_9DEIN|nr:TRAP transporter small permease subunit [Calidithermus terrae]RIH85330.1 Tripartite ATP-independent periplasmic transporter, DctQ component [Calidithermus terrae]
MKALLGLSRFIDGLNAGVNRVVIWMVLLSVLVAAGNAIVRYALNSSSNTWLELQWFMFAAIFLLGASYTLQKNGHVRVDVLYSKYPPRVQVWVDMLGALLFLIPTCVVILMTTWPWAMNSFNIREMSPDAGGLPYWPIKLVLPLGIFLLMLQAVSEVIKRMAMLSGHLPMTEYVSEVEEEIAEIKEAVVENVEPKKEGN